MYYNMTEKSTIIPGGIKYFQLLVDGVDITTLAIKTDIFQDIFTPTWSAQILFSDTQNQLMVIPIKPGSKVDITVETDAPQPCPPKKKKYTFYVYKISDRIMYKQEHQGYILNCVTEEFFKNQKSRISLSLKRKPCDEMVSDVIGELGGTVESDTDPNLYDVIIPNWSPFTAIEWIARFTKIPDGGADFCFFQSDIDGKFKFKSLEKMFTDRTGVTLRQKNPNMRENSQKEDEDSFTNIEKYEFLSQHDTIRNFTTGYYGNTLLTHDIINKTITHTPFNYGDDISEDASNKPFDGKFFEEANDSHITYFPMHPGIASGLTPEETQFDWVGSRKTNVMKLEENRLVISIPGASCSYEWIGKQIYIELPSHQDVEKNQPLDKYWKGDYLVVAIKHTITSSKYELTIECGKKRLDQPYQ